jgi:hypothetical protein
MFVIGRRFIGDALFYLSKAKKVNAMAAHLEVNIDGARCEVRKLRFDANGDQIGSDVQVYSTRSIYFKMFESNQNPDNSTLEMYWEGEPRTPLAHFNTTAEPNEVHILNGEQNVLAIIRTVINHAYYQ